ncbi:MAG: hypothetical protein LEGION0398_MBIBDBAK_01062 [Legionellaceae bacterium]
MIHSMTAFARQETALTSGTVICEIRSVNHRYLDCSFKLPENFIEIEFRLREMIKQSLSRGKIEISIYYKQEAVFNNTLNINAQLLENLININKQVTEKLGINARINTMDLLAWPNIIESPERDNSILHTQVLHVVEKTLSELLNMRQREGKALSTFIQERLDLIDSNLDEIKKHLPEIILKQRSRLENKLAEVVLNYDVQRLEQEMVIWISRYDIEEELKRLESHVQEVRRILQMGGPQGRRLDFLMQELNREANTIGSKSNDLGITNIAISLKVMIEQMREQIQNIE